jgi:ADP-ribose pyrophosphatase
MWPQLSSNEELLLSASRFRVVRLSPTTNGGPARPREVIRHPGSVVILPLVDQQHVCLIRNHRVAVNQTLIELPAGTLEADEPPLEAAARELGEETGYRADNIQWLRSFYAAPGILDEQMTLVLATGLTPGQPQREADEQIENLIVSWVDAIGWVLDGRIHDAKTMVGLLYYDRAMRQGETELGTS